MPVCAHGKRSTSQSAEHRGLRRQVRTTRGEFIVVPQAASGRLALPIMARPAPEHEHRRARWFGRSTSRHRALALAGPCLVAPLVDSNDGAHRTPAHKRPLSRDAPCQVPSASPTPRRWRRVSRGSANPTWRPKGRQIVDEGRPAGGHPQARNHAVPAETPPRIVDSRPRSVLASPGQRRRWRGPARRTNCASRSQDCPGPRLACVRGEQEVIGRVINSWSPVLADLRETRDPQGAYRRRRSSAPGYAHSQKAPTRERHHRSSYSRVQNSAK